MAGVHVNPAANKRQNVRRRGGRRSQEVKSNGENGESDDGELPFSGHGEIRVAALRDVVVAHRDRHVDWERSANYGECISLLQD